jgi:hypothetical protein
MSPYFKPWRRKIGVVTLLMACMFAAGWIRSRSRGDLLQFERGKAIYRIASSSRGMSWETISFNHLGAVKTPTGYFSLDGNGFDPFVDIPEIELDLSRFGFHIVESKLDPHAGFRSRLFAVPYWSVVIPLTLLSAWLLLSKPRRPKVESAGESVSEPVV